MKILSGYKLTPTRSGGGHVQLPASILARAGWCDADGRLLATCRVTFTARKGRVVIRQAGERP